MKEIYSDVLQYRGTHYEYGRWQGELLKDSLVMNNRRKQWRTRRPRFVINPGEVKQMFKAFAPKIWEELLGLCETLDISIEEGLKEFGGYRTEITKSGCSVMTGDTYMIRNYDYHPKTYEGRFMVYAPSDGGYAVMGPSQRITGRMDGMNEKGLVMAYNFVHRKDPGNGFICSMIGRIILETCADVFEAIELLEAIPHRHSFTYTLFDKNGHSYVVEATPRSTHVRQAHICTNHFEQLMHENRHHLVDSYDRMTAIETNSQPGMSAYTAFRLLNDKDQGVFSNKYKNWAGTIHTSAYLPQDLKVWFALGGDKEPFVFDFNQWLKGEDLIIKRVTGTVDTQLSFAHMDHNAR